MDDLKAPAENAIARECLILQAGGEFPPTPELQAVLYHTIGAAYTARRCGLSDKQLYQAVIAGSRLWDDPVTGLAPDATLKYTPPVPSPPPTPEQAMAARAQIRTWAAEAGWAWPEDTETPRGVYSAIAGRLRVSPGTVREVFGGRVRMPEVWRDRWEESGC